MSRLNSLIIFDSKYDLYIIFFFRAFPDGDEWILKANEAAAKGMHVGADAAAEADNALITIDRIDEGIKKEVATATTPPTKLQMFGKYMKFIGLPVMVLTGVIVGGYMAFKAVFPHV